MPRLICMNFKFAQLVLQTKLCFKFSARVVQYYCTFTWALLFLGRSCAMESLVPWPITAKAYAGKLENVCTFYPWTLWLTIFPEIGQFLGTSGIESVPSASKIFVLGCPLIFLSLNFTSDSNTMSNTGENKGTWLSGSVDYISSQQKPTLMFVCFRKDKAMRGLLSFDFAEGVIIVLRGVVHIISLLAICAWIIIELKN